MERRRKKKTEFAVPVEIVDTQDLKEDERKLLETVYKRLDLWEQKCRPYHDEARVMREVMRRNDPEQDPPNTPKHERTLQLHTLANTVENSVSEQMERMPEPKLIPETPDMQEAADLLQDVIHHVLYNVNDFEATHKRRLEDYFVTGTGILQIAWDKDANHGLGDIALIRWPVEAFLWDYQAENIQDARALMKLSWHPMSWYEDHYPDAAPYIHSEEGQHNGIALPDSQQDNGINDEDRALMIEYWYRKYDAKKNRYTINVCYCAGGAFISNDEDVYAHGEYPFILDVHSNIEGQPVGTGMVGEFRTMMQYINKYQKYIDTNLRMSSKGRMLIRRNSGIDKQQLADWSRDTIEGNSIVQGEDWNWLAHAPLNGMNFQEVQSMSNSLQQDAGLSSVMRGVLPSDYASGKAVVALQETGSKISNLRTEGMRASFKKAVEQILWLMHEFYDEDRVVFITGKNGNGVSINWKASALFGEKSGELPPPPYIVQIEINNRNPLRIDQQNEMYMQAYTMSAQAQQHFPLSTLFRLMNIEGKDRLLPAIEANENYQEQMAQLQQQIAEMQEQLAQSQQENEGLKRGYQEMTNSLANIRATTGAGQASPENQDPRKAVGAGAQMGSMDDMLAKAAQATGMNLSSNIQSRLNAMGGNNQA